MTDEPTTVVGLSEFNVDDLGRRGWTLCGLAGAIEIGAYVLDPPLAAPLVVHVPLALTAGAFVAGLAAANFVLVFRGLGKLHEGMEEAADG